MQIRSLIRSCYLLHPGSRSVQQVYILVFCRPWLLITSHSSLYIYSSFLSSRLLGLLLVGEAGGAHDSALLDIVGKVAQGTVAKHEIDLLERKSLGFAEEEDEDGEGDDEVPGCFTLVGGFIQ